MPGVRDDHQVDGSCMIVIATDAPLSARNLERLANRPFLALGRVGSFMSNGSGDYAIAFSTHPDCRIPYRAEAPVRTVSELENDQISPLFLAVVEATEEAIYNTCSWQRIWWEIKGRSIEGTCPLSKPWIFLIVMGRSSVLNIDAEHKI